MKIVASILLAFALVAFLSWLTVRWMKTGKDKEDIAY